ncbi:FliM/FliN family flagellar motor switch protein [Roseomonas marmotae]|uniref:Flagellar motor switch protein FliM n=1 Tax=Roseomonas marmotae TaxID=2768161 RepID=A0ABS3KF16_9PROT|nr:FliM/FliN family flagellar motor switch protein [Roseomonas marmotae]MBO1076059.1 FliM/FliN family flagellar motor switch protein [Roseomonas marmotae]QTI81298.1 FliM/FliN family flagellar motor switch protein [Roseomonas marmotae]
MSGTEDNGAAGEPAEDPMADWGAAGMAMGQGDIDSLFGGPDPAATETARTGLEALVGGAVRHEKLPMLDIVVDRLARLLTTSIRKFTADNADAMIDRMRPVRVGAFLDTVTLPAMIGIIRIEEWDGYCLAALDSRLIGSIVDILLGGRRNAVQPIEGRPYTPIERAFVEKFVGVLTQDMGRAFEAVSPATFRLERFEITPGYALITKPTAAALTFRAEITMEGRGGHIDFLLPYASIEPVRDLLSQEVLGKKVGGDTIWRSHLAEELPRASAELTAVIDSRTMSFAEVARWQPGSVIALDRRPEDNLDVFCQGLLVCRARMAARDDRVVLRVEDCVIEKTWPGDTPVPEDRGETLMETPR